MVIICIYFGQIMNIGYKNHQKGYTFKTNDYWRYQVLLIQSGSLLLKTDKIISKVNPGQLILFPLHSQFELECVDQYSGLFFAHEKLNLKTKNAITFTGDQIIHLIYNLIEIELQQTTSHQELISHYVKSILIKINNPIVKKKNTSPGNYHKNIAQMIKLKLEANIHSNESTEELLKHIHLSYRQLSRYFQKYFNSSIKKYHIQLRIKKVQELLLHENLSVTTIAYELGFSSSQHLSNQFKKITGATPSEWLQFTNQNNNQKFSMNRQEKQD